MGRSQTNEEKSIVLISILDQKENFLWHKLKFSILYICSTRWCKP